jgi:2,3-bisphosphoglycerate-dependent phosphoglycerate mutase
MKKIIKGLAIVLFYFFGVHVSFSIIGQYSGDNSIFFGDKPLNYLVMTLVNIFAFYEIWKNVKQCSHCRNQKNIIIGIGYFLVISIGISAMILINVSNYNIMYEFVMTTLGFIYLFSSNTLVKDSIIKLVLLRHGESIWNLENRFTGWTDVALSFNGVKEAQEAGLILKKHGYMFDVAFTSVLKRASDTLKYVTMILETPNLRTHKSWKLNERHYGALQGLNKEEVAEKYGVSQVKIWRRSATVYPPALTKDDSRYPGNDSLYKDLSDDELPLTENLNDTLKRVVEYWNEAIVPSLKNGDSVLVVAHGNSLRALVKYLDNLNDEEVMNLNIPTGKPLIYELDDNLKPLAHYYLEN